jgi:hypothetical protein
MLCRGFKKGTTIPCGNKVPDAGYYDLHKDQDVGYYVGEGWIISFLVQI